MGGAGAVKHRCEEGERGSRKMGDEEEEGGDDVRAEVNRKDASLLIQIRMRQAGALLTYLSEHRNNRAKKNMKIK